MSYLPPGAPPGAPGAPAWPVQVPAVLLHGPPDPVLSSPLLAGDHAGEGGGISQRENYQRHHPVFRAGLDVRLNRNVLLSRISAAMEGVFTMISNAATRPGLSMRGMSTAK